MAWGTTTAKHLGDTVPALPLLLCGRDGHLAAVGEWAKHFSPPRRSPSSQVWRDGQRVVARRAGTGAAWVGEALACPSAMCGAMLTCLERKTGFKHSQRGCIYSGRSQLLCCSHIYIYSVLDIWVLWQIMTYLHAVFVWQRELHWSLSPWGAFMQPCYSHSWVLYVVSFL